jgi:hypothetical protein
LYGRDSDDRNPEMGGKVKKMRKFRCTRQRGDACGYNRRRSKPGAVSGTSKWEIPV